MSAISYPVLIAWSLAAIFGLSGLVHLAGPRALKAAYTRWNFPRGFYRVTGILEILAAAFLAMAVTRIWGVAIAGLVLFVAVITLLNHRQYAYAVPGMLLLAALAPATLASTF